MPTTLPDKLFYKIGEVAEAARVKTSVLRFWETEFSFLKPEKSTTGQRLYSKREVDLVLQVRRLLYEEKYTLEGVKKKISSRGRLIDEMDLKPKEVEKDLLTLLSEIKNDLMEIRNIL